MKKETTEIITPQIKILHQEVYCKENNVEVFCPSDGICWGCNRQIFDKISLETCETKLITGCPYCNGSFVE